MYTSIKGIYQNGQLILLESPPALEKAEVIITFIPEENQAKTSNRRLGGLEGKISIPDNFNEPLNDFDEYMS